VGDASRPYGQGNPAFSYTVTGALVNGDTYATVVEGVPVYSTSGTPTSPAGAYPVSVAGLSASNYVVAFLNGTLTVTRAMLGQNGVVNITLTSSVNPSVYGDPVIFTATVPAPATGAVVFSKGVTVLGTGTIANGIATLTTSSLSVGTNPVTAVYSGDTNYNGGAVATMIETVTGAAATVLDFTLTLTSAPSQTVISGQAASYALQVAPTSSAYPGVVTFTATGLPAGAIATFAPATVAANAGPTPVFLSVQTASIVATNKLEKNATPIALGLLLLPLAGARRMRRSGRLAGRYLFMMLVVLAGAVATGGLTGCGDHNGFFGHAPQIYNITITATSATIQHSVNATLTVQ
jgi:hypothetical protein